MVNFKISNTNTPSEAAPHLTINHDVAADLDSTNAFEGPEKLLEVWFAPGANLLPLCAKENGLKAVSSETWVTMLDMVNCKILSVLKSDHVDAYLLSESSMFVWPHKIILKTCGTTTLLLGLQRLLQIAAVDAGFPFHNVRSVDDKLVAATPYRVFYSRKNFLFPDRQQGPHRSWGQEVKFLDDMFENGSAYMVGKMNGDHWYLYITSPNNTMTPPRTPEHGAQGNGVVKIPTGVLSFNPNLEENNDETLEILMTDLDPENAKQFYLENASAVACDKFASQPGVLDHISSSISSLPSNGNAAASMTGSTAGSVYDETCEVFSNGDSEMQVPHTPVSEHGVPECLTTEGHALGTVVSENCGLSDVYPRTKYPDARIDSYLFTPCGFSANGLVPATSNGSGSTAAHYFTVHVTPEPNCSYASFETNVPGGQNGRDTVDIIDHVVRIFKPGRFSVTLFEAKGKGASPLDPLDEEDRRTPTRKKRLERINGYRRIDRIVHDFDDYDLVFRFYEREDWVGGDGVRVGEMM